MIISTKHWLFSKESHEDTLPVPLAMEFFHRLWPEYLWSLHTVFFGKKKQYVKMGEFRNVPVFIIKDRLYEELFDDIFIVLDNLNEKVWFE